MVFCLYLDVHVCALFNWIQIGLLRRYGLYGIALMAPLNKKLFW